MNSDPSQARSLRRSSLGALRQVHAGGSSTLRQQASCGGACPHPAMPHSRLV